MGVLTLNPSAFYNYGRGSWTTVGTSGPVALSDGSDATYIKLSTNYSGTNGASWKTRVASGQLPGGAKVEYMRAVMRAKTDLASGAGSEQYFRIMIQNIRGGNPLGTNRPFTSGQKKVTTSYTNIYNEIEKTTMSNGKYYGDGSITQADLGFLVIEFYDVATTHIFISKAWIEVSYDEKPVITINDPGTIGETTSPIITFNYSDDKMPLDAVDVELYDNGGNLIHSAEKVTLPSPSYGIPISLEDGDYTVKMRAYQQWNYNGDAPVSDWDEASFTIAIGRPAQPEFVAIEEDSQARVRLVAKSNLNLLSNDAAEGMPAAWNDLFNATIGTGDLYQALAGDRSLLMKVTSSGPGFMKAFAVSLVPVTQNIYYTFGFNARAYTGDTLVNVQAGIRWFNSSGVQVGSDAFGANFMEIAGVWKPVYINTQAPATAAFAKPFISVNSSQANGWHYIDALQLQAQAAYAEPLPAWSRGGFATGDSVNLLTYGDSTFEGASHWTAVAAEVNSKEATVSVVNVEAETGDIEDSYQGDNMLKIATVDTLIKRDVEPNFSNTTSISVSKGDTVDGDYMVVQITTQGTTTVTTPGGWTLLNTTASGTAHRIYAFGKFASSEPATLTFTASATGKHAISLEVWTGIDPTTPVDSITVSSVQTGTVFTVPTSNVPHNAPVIQSAWGRRAAATVATSFTSNLGGNNDILLSTTANTASEVAAGVFSRKYNTGSTTALSLTGRTITCANSLTDVLTVSIVLRPDRSTVRATLRDYEYYEFDSTLTYTVHAALLGASSTSGVNSANRAVGFLVDVYDNDKNYINGYYAYQGFAVPGQWLKMSNTINVPDNAAIKYATIRIEVDQITDYEAYYIDAVSLYQSSTNLGYIEGFKEIDGPYIEVEYSEDEGETWQTADSTDSTWMVQKITDFSDATIEFLDYEIASETPRLYRMYNWKMEEGNLLQSDYSAEVEAEIKLYRIWMHLINDPVGTIYHFEYDGQGRDDGFDKQATIQQFNGREYGQVYFSETSARTINANVQLPTGESIEALKRLDRTKALIIFRDGRGRRVKGLLNVKISDEKYGQAASFSVGVYGLQP
jgi:hypothetical protein